MAYVMHKYQIPFVGGCVIRIPKMAKMRSVGVQNTDMPVVWYEVEDEHPKTHAFSLSVIPTGHEIPPFFEFLGTFQIPITEPPYVWVGHVYFQKHEIGIRTVEASV